MAIKQIRAKVGQTVDYKIIKDTYKTVTDRFVVSEDMDMVSTIDLNAPTESYTPTADYTISKLGEHKIITFNNDIVLPDDIVMEKDEYALIPYDGNVHYIPQNNVEGRWNDNFNRVGSVQIVSNTASNFSSSNYISLQDTFDSSKPWVVGFKFNLNVIDNTSKILLCHNTSGLFKLTIYEGKIEFSVSTITSDWTIGQIVGTQVLQPHKDYWVKAEFTGSAYNVYISEDGLNYNLEGTLESSEAFVMPSQLLIGNGGWQMNEAFTGVIYLNETYIESDGEIWWKPECQNKIGQYSTIGSRAIIQDGIARGFSSENYLYLDNTKYSSTDNTTYVFKFNAPSTSLSTSQCVFEQDHFANLEFRYATQDMRAWNWGAGQYEYIMTPVLGKTYWFKMVVNGTTKTYYWSEDGVNYDNSYVMTDTNMITTSNIMYIGRTNGDFNHYQEKIDIKNSWIQINGETHYINDICSFNGYWNDEGVIKGFSSNNYLTINTPSVVPNTFDIQFKITTNANDETSARILNAIGGSDTVNGLFIVRESKNIQLSFYNGSSYRSYVAISGSEDGVTYLVRWVWDGTTVKSYYSTTTEEDFILNEELEATSFPLAAFNYSMGVRTLSPKYTLFNGSIDLNGCYIKINNKLVWQGIAQSNLQSANFQVIGTPTIDANGVVSNFSDYNYIVFPYAGNNETEIFTTFTTGTDISNMANIITFQGCGEIYIRDSVMQTWNIETGTDMTLTSMLPNTMYSLRMKMIPNGRIITIYDADNTIIDEHTINDSGATFNNNSIIRFGFYDANSTSRHWKGSIDLTKTYVKTNDEMKYLCEMNGKYLQGILDKETDATTLKLFANTLVMEKDAIVYPFEQPTMTSNGVMGNSNVACSSSKNVYNNMYPYYVFNNDNTIWHTDSSSSPWDIVYYSKEAIKPTKINIINRNTDPSYVYPATSLTVYGSTDGATYTQIGYTKNSVTANAGQWSCDIETPMVVNYLKFVFTNNYNYFALTYIGIEAEIVKQSTHKGVLLLAEDKNLQNNGLFVQYIGDVEIPTLEEDNEGTDEPESFFHNYYAWTTTTTGTSLPTTVYTLSTTPSVGDIIYNEHGEATTMTAIGVASDHSYINPGTPPAFFLPPEYYRDSEKDIMKNDSPGLDIGNEEFEEGDDFEML